MEVLLLENYLTLGHVGDIVRVAPGFARNLLFPRRIAVEFPKRNQGAAKHLLSSIAGKKARLKADAESLKAKIEAAEFEFTFKPTADAAKMFGTVTTRDVEAKLKELGADVERRQITMSGVIKKVGEYKAKVKLHSEVTAEIKLTVKQDAAAVKAARSTTDGDQGAKKKSAARKKASAKQSGEEAGSESTAATPAAE